MQQRGDACGFAFWEEATRGLHVRPAGPGSEEMTGGIGALSYDGMREYLRTCGAYLYTGTRPASYTLGLIEAMMTGVPVVAMESDRFHPAALYEAGELTGLEAGAAHANQLLRNLIEDPEFATAVGESQRDTAIELFGLDGVIAQWAEFLGVAA